MKRPKMYSPDTYGQQGTMPPAHIFDPRGGSPTQVAERFGREVFGLVDMARREGDAERNEPRSQE